MRHYNGVGEKVDNPQSLPPLKSTMSLPAIKSTLLPVTNSMKAAPHSDSSNKAIAGQSRSDVAKMMRVYINRANAASVGLSPVPDCLAGGGSDTRLLLFDEGVITTVII